MEQQLAHTHVFNKQIVDDKYLVSGADCEHAAVYRVSCACGEVGTETFTSGEALGHDYKYGVCHCGHDVLPEIIYDAANGTVTLEGVPADMPHVIISVNAGEKMLCCAFGNAAEPIKLPAAALQQGDCIRVFYLDANYAPVLMAGFYGLK